jgi:hypothetical protein
LIWFGNIARLSHWSLNLYLPSLLMGGGGQHPVASTDIVESKWRPGEAMLNEVQKNMHAYFYLAVKTKKEKNQGKLLRLTGGLLQYII